MFAIIISLFLKLFNIFSSKEEKLCRNFHKVLDKIIEIVYNISMLIFILTIGRKVDSKWDLL